MEDSSRSLLGTLLHRRNHFRLILLTAILGAIGLGILTVGAYSGAPPVAGISGPVGKAVVTRDEILEGQEIFLRKGLMSYGSFFGDGASRGPDFTAQVLHIVADRMAGMYLSEGAGADAARSRVRREIKENGWDGGASILVPQAQAAAFPAVVGYFESLLNGSGTRETSGGAPLTGAEIRKLAAFAFWGAWVCAANRPGESYSYTHNWPFDPDAGNVPTPDTILWSLLSVFALVLGSVFVLYVYGQRSGTAPSGHPLLSTMDAETGTIREGQRETFAFFSLAMAVFGIQSASGALTALQFLRGTYPMIPAMPLVALRSWHTFLQIFWFFLCWIGLTLFLVPSFSARLPPGHAKRVRFLFRVCLFLGMGAILGICLGPAGLLPAAVSLWLGHQGWEFMELGRAWLVLMLLALSYWVLLLWRGFGLALRRNPWCLEAWLFYSVAGMVLFFYFGLLVTPSQNFVLADFWRWMVVHMWVEATFEVYTTVVVGCLMVRMGFVQRAVAERAILLAVVLFLATAINGVAHNYYWVGKPTSTLAIGSVFSTLQVLPLLLLTLDAWRIRKQERLARGFVANGSQVHVLDETWLYLLATNFWNVFGAGVLGSLINLPIINYFEHSTYLTGNHAHAAMFGVKGNVAIAGAMFVGRHLIPAERWNPRLMRQVFWCLNLGLALMMLLDLFPLGLYQFWTVINRGLWYARSEAFVQSGPFQVLTQLRGVGATLFLLGGSIPLARYFLRARRMVFHREPPRGSSENVS